MTPLPYTKKDPEDFWKSTERTYTECRGTQTRGQSPTKNNGTHKKYNLSHAKTAVNNGLPVSLQDQFDNLIDEFSDVFSKNEWDIGKCDVTSYKVHVCHSS